MNPGHQGTEERNCKGDHGKRVSRETGPFINGTGKKNNYGKHGGEKARDNGKFYSQSRTFQDSGKICIFTLHGLYVPLS